jgi:hypothetical protein
VNAGPDRQLCPITFGPNLSDHLHTKVLLFVLLFSFLFYPLMSLFSIRIADGVYFWDGFFRRNLKGSEQYAYELARRHFVFGSTGRHLVYLFGLPIKRWDVSCTTRFLHITSTFVVLFSASLHTNSPGTFH